MLSEFAKVFDRKVSRVQIAHLHNAARALSSPCSFVIFAKHGRDLKVHALHYAN